MKKSIKLAGLAPCGVVLGFFVLLYTGIIWRSPAYYATKPREFKVKIMDMKAYDSLGGSHERPYLYQIKTGKGGVYVMGIEHTRDVNNKQIPLINAAWNTQQPDIAFVEGRLGFLMSGLQDPVAEYGEGGLTVSLAKEDRVPFFTWEPKRDDEVTMMLERFPAEQVALFYSLRPYFSDFRFGKPSDPDAVMNDLIESRTDFEGIRGKITCTADVDRIWKRDFKTLKDWRDTSDEFGWPDGYLSAIFDYSNQLRDIHMCSAILDEVSKGNKVFVTMGSSHAFRIEKTLRAELSKQFAAN